MEYPNKETAYELQLSVSALRKKCTVLFKDVAEIRSIITAENKKRWANRTSELDRLKYVQVFKEEKNDNN
jgi:hypothetical protein